MHVCLWHVAALLNNIDPGRGAVPPWPWVCQRASSATVSDIGQAVAVCTVLSTLLHALQALELEAALPEVPSTRCHTPNRA